MDSNTNKSISMIEEQKVLLAQAKEEGNPNKICEILGRISRGLVDSGQADEALPYLDEAISIADKNGLLEVKASNLGNRGVALVRLKRFDKAREYFNQVEEIAREIDHPALQCDTLLQKAIMHLEISRGELAQRDLMDALAIAEGIADTTRQMKIQALLGHTFFSIASFDEANNFFSKALILAEEMDNLKAQSGYHHNLGNIFYAANVPEKAITHFIKAVDIFRDLGDQQGEKNALLRLAKSYADGDQPEETYTTAREGFTLSKSIGDPIAASAFINLCILASNHLGRLEDSLEMIGEAMSDAESEGDSERMLNLYISTGNTYYEMDKYAEAKDAYLEGLDVSTRLQNWEYKTRILGRLSAVEADQGNLDKSIEYGEEALKFAEKVGSGRLIGEQYMMLAFGARDQGDMEAAKDYAEKARENFTIIEAQAALEKLNQFIEELPK